MSESINGRQAAFYPAKQVLRDESPCKISPPCSPNCTVFTLTLILSLGLPLGSTKNGPPVPITSRCRRRPDGCLKCFKHANGREKCAKVLSELPTIAGRALSKSEEKPKSRSHARDKSPPDIDRLTQRYATYLTRPLSLPPICAPVPPVRVNATTSHTAP